MDNTKHKNKLFSKRQRNAARSRKKAKLRKNKQAYDDQQIHEELLGSTSQSQDPHLYWEPAAASENVSITGDSYQSPANNPSRSLNRGTTNDFSAHSAVSHFEESRSPSPVPNPEEFGFPASEDEQQSGDISRDQNLQLRRVSNASIPAVNASYEGSKAPPDLFRDGIQGPTPPDIAQAPQYVADQNTDGKSQTVEPKEPQVKNDQQGTTTTPVNNPIHTQTPRVQHVILVQENGRTNHIDQRMFLHRAALKDDWNSVKEVIQKNRSLATLPITERQDSLLHVAAATKSKKIVCGLVQLMTKTELEKCNIYKNTALCYAAASGDVEIASLMSKKNTSLPLERGSNGMTPIYMAASLGHKDMVKYLASVTLSEDVPLEKRLSNKERSDLLQATIHSGMYEIASKLLDEDDIPASKKASALHILAGKPTELGYRDRDWFWRTIVRICPILLNIPWLRNINDDILSRKQATQLVARLWEDVRSSTEDKKIPDDEIVQVLQTAAKEGNFEFLTELIRSYPDLIWKTDSKRHTIFHTAVLYRHENIFGLIFHIGAIKDLLALGIDTDGNNILHLAGAKSPGNRQIVASGAALMMQKELLWFKEVKKIVLPSYLTKKNKNGLTPSELFSRTNARMRREGEEWMKGKAESSMIVATLIATVVFAAAFTVPGGLGNDSGIPIFLQNKWFTVFMISVSVAMCSSTTSIVMFLSILTSRYAEADFMGSLPAKLMFGLLALFVSIVCMLLAFVATFFEVYKSQMIWVPRVLVALACIPVTLFALLHSKLWFDTIRSTYWSRFLFRPQRHKIY